jgi:hypothetical protein
VKRAETSWRIEIYEKTGLVIDGEVNDVGYIRYGVAYSRDSF